MNRHTAYHQFGRFIVGFQHLEEAINDLLELTAGGDCESVRILANDLGYASRLKTADVLFARFVDLRINVDAAVKGEFHQLMTDLQKLGERRNTLVHSRYFQWLDAQGNEGLLRINSRLQGRKGSREQNEEELQPQAFDGDLQRLVAAAKHLESFRLRIIDWLYSENGA